MTAIELRYTTPAMLQTLSDEDVLRLISEGNSPAMEEMVRRYQKPIYRFLMRFLDSAEDAEQTTLNVLVRAWEYAPRFQYRSKVSTWLYRIAFNMARDLFERRKSRPQQIPLLEQTNLGSAGVKNAEDEALNRMEMDDKYHHLQCALKQLSDADRLLIILYYFEESSYEEMEVISGFSYKVLKTRLSRARQRLRAILEQES
ncbi:MAG: RNA polymerase sigma factor [Armatimonadetes bacterium]|nr:RNA polymerase sigma factor [Armatimonadota bacterium]